MTLNYRDSRPMYQQITDNYKKMILSGVVAPNEKLPSVRELALQLSINPNTIQRAYRELESEGFIYTVQGKGCFAAEKRETDSVLIAQLTETFKDAASKLILLGVSKKTLTDYIPQSKQEVQND